MTPSHLIAMPGNEVVGNRLAAALNAELARLELRRFPDGETYLRLFSAPAGKPVAILCTLDRPDEKLLPLIFAADTARELDASEIGLVCPYLSYMRQDKRFRPGEAITSESFARILSRHFDWLVTIDPHLHRHASLGEIYSIPAVALQAAPLLARWIAESVERPLVIGPDAESEQWVAAVASAAGAPHVVLEKIRHSDRRVEVSLPNIQQWREYVPVLVDDIASTAQTMIGATRKLLYAGMRNPVCVAIHGLFVEDAYAELTAAGASLVVTTNTVPHQSNAIDVTKLLAASLSGELSRR